MLCVHGTDNSADRGFIGRILSARIPLHHQRPNLDVQLLDIGLADFCALLRFRPAENTAFSPSAAHRFHSPTIVWWMPCWATSCAAGR
jgi:hypothetical protein